MPRMSKLDELHLWNDTFYFSTTEYYQTSDFRSKNAAFFGSIRLLFRQNYLLWKGSG